MQYNHKQEPGGNIYLHENWHRDGVIPTITKHKQDNRKEGGASVAETTLTYFIKLWEIRNEEVHGKPVEQQEKLNSAQMQGK